METNKNLNIINKGLNQDISKEFQPEGTYPFALNAVPETKDGEIGSLSNEAGNTHCYTLTEGYIPIGQIPILDDKTIIFSVRPYTLADPTTKSEIGVVQNCVYSVLINSDCLAFDITKQIRGIFRVREGCNTNIYFTDNTNPWRAIDIDNLTQYLATGYTTAAQANADSLGWDCNSFKLFRNYDQSNIDMQVFNTGGNTNVGMYQFTYQYLDDDFNPQPWLTPSNPIPIVKDSLNEYTGLDGDETGTVTNKSIQLTLSNLDDRYSYVRIGLIVSDFGTGFNSNAYILEELPIEDNTINYLFQGIDPNKTRNTDLESFTFLPPDYYTGKDLNQIDNSLVLAYPRAREIDWIPFLQAALEIQSTYYIRDLFAEGTGQESFGNRYPNSYYYNKSLMRDEVYAFGIVYVFEDGTETPAFHIPGRAANTYHDTTSIDLNEALLYDNNFPGNVAFNLHNRLRINETYALPDTNGLLGWDTTRYPANNSIVEPNVIDDNQEDADGYIARWKLFNTAIRTSANWITDPSTPEDNYIVEGELAYFESQDYVYPDTRDCSGNLIYGDLVGQPIRYHKMPDSTLEPHYYGYTGASNPHANEFAYIRPLSVKFDNINLPAIEGVSGYRIVRVERNDYNKSIIDKGIINHNKFLVDTGNADLKYVFQHGAYDAQITANLSGVERDILGIPTTTDITNITGEPDTYVTNTILSFHSPKTKILKDSVSGDYVKLERTLNHFGDSNLYSLERRSGNTRVYYDETSDNNFCIGDNRTFHYASTGRMNLSYIPTSVINPDRNYTNRVITKQAYIPAHSGASGASLTYPFYNQCQNETFIIETRDGAETEIYVAPEVVTSTLVGNGFIEPTASIEPFSTLGSNPCVNPEAFVNVHPTSYYASLKRYLPNQYNGIHQLTYSCPGKFETATSYLYNNGDCFINDWGFKKYIDSEGPIYDPCAVPNAVRMTVRTITRFWCESDINMELRDSSGEASFHFEGGCVLSEANKYDLSKMYYPYYYNENKGNVRDFLEPELAWIDGRFGTVRNWYSYNKDFSIENTVRSFFPLPINFDYCNTCLVKFPHRLANSNKAYQEERADNYRIFLPNNYRDIPGETGSINEIFIKDNKLFIHTTQSLWYQQVKPQQIQTDQATLYVGTGEFWEIPPNEIMTSLNGYAGCQHQVGTINTPFGYFYPSERERKVFFFGGIGSKGPVLNEISNEGLRNWFETNLPFNITQSFPTVPTDNPANPLGVGFTVAYDKRHRRIIFSKKDFVPISGLGITYAPYCDPENCPRPGFKLPTGVNVDLEDPQYFENKSWTISYHPETNSWTSWHSYLPFFMWNDQNNYYTHSRQKTNGAVSFVEEFKGFKHNQELNSLNLPNFMYYYDIPCPHIIELVAKQSPLITNLFDNINYYNKVYSYDSTNQQWIEQPLTTFDKLIVYNDNQATPEMNIVVSNNTPFQSVITPTVINPILVTKAEQDWNISGFIDYTNNATQSLFSTTWANLQTDYYVDKVVNPLKIDTNQSPFGLQQFRSKYINYRLIFSNAPDDNNNPPNYKIVSKYNTTLTRTSDR